MQNIDHNQVAEMIDHGFTAAQIGERLGCSARHVRRIAEARRLAFNPNPLIGTPQERMLWEACRSMRMKPADIAYAFGRSRQALHEYFNRPRIAAGGGLQ